MANEVATQDQQLAFEVERKPEEVTEKKEVKPEIVEVDERKDEVAIPHQEALPVASQSAFQSMDSFKQSWTLAQNLAKSDLVPQMYKGNPANAVIALDLAERLGVSPLYVMQNLSIVRGIPSWSGQACLSIIRGCGRYKNVQIIYEGERGKENRSCRIEAIEKASGEKVVGTTIDWQMIRSEGWDKNPKWKSMTEQMFAYRAAAFFARLYCSNEMGGYKVEGEVEDITKPEPSKAVDVYADAK